MIDIVIPAFNRLEFTKAMVECLIQNTDWSRVRLVRIHDDGSSDGTDEYLSSLSWPVPREFRFRQVGGPVAVLNAYLRDHWADGPPVFAKVDTDTLMPKGWLGDCLRVINQQPELDLLGFECTNDFPEPAPYFRKYERAPHIGGIGLMRRRPFERHGLPNADGRQGFTQWQEKYDVRCGWLTPSLPVVLLDHLPMDPWRSLSEEYIAKGWQRRGWGELPEQQYYAQKSFRLWEWFLQHRGSSEQSPSDSVRQVSPSADDEIHASQQS